MWCELNQICMPWCCDRVYLARVLHISKQSLYFLYVAMTSFTHLLMYWLVWFPCGTVTTCSCYRYNCKDGLYCIQAFFVVFRQHRLNQHYSKFRHPCRNSQIALKTILQLALCCCMNCSYTVGLWLIKLSTTCGFSPNCFSFAKVFQSAVIDVTCS